MNNDASGKKRGKADEISTISGKQKMIKSLKSLSWLHCPLPSPSPECILETVLNCSFQSNIVLGALENSTFRLTAVKTGRMGRLFVPQYNLFSAVS